MTPIAQTLFEQIKELGILSKEPPNTIMAHKTGLNFHYKARRKHMIVNVAYNQSTDLYDVKTYQLKGINLKQVCSSEGRYTEDLPQAFQTSFDHVFA